VSEPVARRSARAGPGAGATGGAGTTPVDAAAVLDGLPDAVLIVDGGGTVRYLNRAGQRLFGWGADEVVGADLDVLVPPPLRRVHRRGLARMVATAPDPSARMFRTAALHRDGAEIPVEVAAVVVCAPDPVVELTVRPLPEPGVADRLADATSRLLWVLAEATTVTEAVSGVARALAEGFGWDVATVWLDGGGGVLRCRAVWAAPGVAYPAFERASRESERGRGEGLVGRVWEGGHAVWVQDIDREAPFPRAEAARAAGLHAAFGFPVTSGDRRLGVVELFSREPMPPEPGLLGVARALGLELGAFLERRLVEEESHALLAREQTARERTAALARTLQQSLLPPALPEIPGVELAARYQAGGEGTDVGGDFYDVFPTGRASWGLVVGDVCGRGAEAAALTALVRYTTRAAAVQARTPAGILRAVNRAMVRQDIVASDRFATAVYAALRLTGGRGRLVVAAGGHPHPLIVRAGGDVEPAGRPGQLLGAFPKAHFENRAVMLEPGDAAVFYTDGIFEVRGPGGQLGEERLAACLAGGAGAPADELAELAEAAALEHGGGILGDDVAVLVVRVSPLVDA
jgi:sigma-B regulation protein RsbU (phosphoserine phosphatase)